MVKLPLFNHWLSEAIKYAPSNPEAAAWLLKEMATYLRRASERNAGPIEIPSDAAKYLADAFERTARVPAKARPAELARALNLTSAGRRPKAPRFELACAVWECSGSLNDAIGVAAEKFDVDVSTVRRAWREYRQTFYELSELQHEQD